MIIQLCNQDAVGTDDAKAGFSGHDRGCLPKMLNQQQVPMLDLEWDMDQVFKTQMR